MSKREDYENRTEELLTPIAEVRQVEIYDVEYVKELLEEYDVSYIFVGSKEREKYGDALNEEVLNSLGEVVFQDEVYSTYILKINK